MEDIFNWACGTRRRMDGPLKLRLIPPPAVAEIFAIRDELKDARESAIPTSGRSSPSLGARQVDP